MTHSFAVCAYGDSPYLEACLRSLVRQSVSSERLLCTATPSAFLKDLAKKYGFRYCVREGKPGIGADWNFALSQAEGSFVTLAHQDDVYGAHYTEELLRAVKRYPNLALFTSDARILKNGAIQRRSKAECVKKLLRLPLRLPFFKSTTAGKRLSLRLGNPIVCPSCAYRRDLLGVSPFSTSLRFVLDWDLLYRFAAEPGSWFVSERPLLLYRIHSGAATAALTENHVREAEESAMFRRMWPEKIAALILRAYRSAYVDYKG